MRYAACCRHGGTVHVPQGDPEHLASGAPEMLAFNLAGPAGATGVPASGDPDTRENRRPPLGKIGSIIREICGFFSLVRFLPILVKTGQK